MKITSAVKKVLKKLNSLIKKEKKLAEMEQDNFLNESFEEEIEENLQNELLEAKLALVLAMAAPCERMNLRLQVSSSTVNIVSGCQQAQPQYGWEDSVDQDGEEETNRDCLWLAGVKVDLRSFDWTRRQHASEENQSRSQEDEEDAVNEKQKRNIWFVFRYYMKYKNESHSVLFVWVLMLLPSYLECHFWIISIRMQKEKWDWRVLKNKWYSLTSKEAFFAFFSSGHMQASDGDFH